VNGEHEPEHHAEQAQDSGGIRVESGLQVLYHALTLRAYGGLRMIFKHALAVWFPVARHGWAG
jgi:hypothetical protein